MSTEEMTRRLKEELICSICLGYFSDPVSIHCGHTFCRACITKYWHWMKKNHFHCPRCRATSRKKILKPNRELRNIAEIVPKLNEKTEEKGKMRGRMCQRHQEPLKLFCKNDRMAICMVCDKSREHKDHMMFPVEEAILEYEQEFQDQLVSLKKEKEKLLTFQAVNSARSEEALNTINAEMQKTALAFKQVDQFLDEQKQLLLTQWKSLQVAVKEQQVHSATISEEVSCLDSLISVAEERWPLLDYEFLQEVQTTLMRLKKRKFQGLNYFFPGEEERLDFLMRQNGAVTQTLRELKARLSSELQKEPREFPTNFEKETESGNVLPWDREGEEEDSSPPAAKRKQFQHSHLPANNRKLEQYQTAVDASDCGPESRMHSSPSQQPVKRAPVGDTNMKKHEKSSPCSLS